MQRETSIEGLRRLVAKFMAYGQCELASVGKHADRWFANLAMSCERPVRATYVARFALGAKPGRPLVAVALYRCRKCTACERTNSMRWAARAVDEYKKSARTWFGTLTLRPDQHALVDQWVADADLWPERSRLSDAQFQKALFRARASIVGQQVTSWLDVVREIAYLRTHRRELIRYMLVAERHDSKETSEFMRGRPHFHIVLHEAVTGAAVVGDIVSAFSGTDNNEVVGRKKKMPDGTWKQAVYASDEAMLRKAWVLGHSTFEYCFDEKAAFYVCKYLYQSDMARVRASVRYGSEADEKDEPERRAQSAAEASAGERRLTPNDEGKVELIPSDVD